MSEKYYTLLKSEREIDLVETANNWIGNGYEPLGGLVIKDNDFYQVMYKKPPLPQMEGTKSKKEKK